MYFSNKAFRLWALLLFPVVASGVSFDHSHSTWDALVKSYVYDGLIDYEALSPDTSSLDRYLQQLNSVARSEVDAWPREQQLAFWINAYNAFTVRVILDHYPIETWTLKGLFVPRNSIIQIPGVWKELTWQVAGQLLTLDHIEHGLIRPRFKEPRIHFSIVCASIGCPDLRNEAFTFEKLEDQLEAQTRSYLSQEKGVVFDYKDREVCVSQLFKWFWEDFSVEAPAGFRVDGKSDKVRFALQFIARYRQKPDEWELLQAKDSTFDYLSYDWTLNDLNRTHDADS